jgi:tyrosinase
LAPPVSCPIRGKYVVTTELKQIADSVQQVLTQCAQNVAKKYTGSNLLIYQTAADNLRMPYWDWAADPRMPDFISVANVQITTPTGITSVRNPLSSYRFKRYPLDTRQFPPTSLSVFPQTVRSPLTNTANVVSDVTGINSLMLGGNLMQRTVCRISMIDTVTANGVS